MKTLSASSAWRCWILPLMSLLSTTRLAAGEVQILLPLGRTAYQTNEWIDMSVVRSARGPVTLSLAGDDGSRLSFSFADRLPSAAEPVRRTEHLHVNGWLLRPGHYKVMADVAGDRAPPAEIDV